MSKQMFFIVLLNKNNASFNDGSGTISMKHGFFQKYLGKILEKPCFVLYLLYGKCGANTRNLGNYTRPITKLFLLKQLLHWVVGCYKVNRATIFMTMRRKYEIEVVPILRTPNHSIL